MEMKLVEFLYEKIEKKKKKKKRKRILVNSSDTKLYGHVSDLWRSIPLASSLHRCIEHTPTIEESKNVWPKSDRENISNRVV